MINIIIIGIARMWRDIYEYKMDTEKGHTNIYFQNGEYG